MPEHNTGNLGGTMRLGKRTTVFKTQDSVLKKLYGDQVFTFTFLRNSTYQKCYSIIEINFKEFIEERHRHRYEVNPDFVPEIESAGLKFVGHDTEKKRMEIMELEGHPFYVAVQYHPEYISRPMRPSPPYLVRNFKKAMNFDHHFKSNDLHFRGWY